MADSDIIVSLRLVILFISMVTIAVSLKKFLCNFILITFPALPSVGST
jgi:hypothetical protein